MTSEREPEPVGFGDDAIDRAMFRTAMEGYAQAYVREGRLDVQDLSDEEILQAVIELLRVDLDDTADAESMEGLVTISFEESLLTEARRFGADGKLEFAVTMYATWFEHWLNALLLWGIERRGLSEPDARQAVREANIRAKTGHLWTLVFAEQLEPTISEVIRAVAERRNEFVHYKWPDAEAFTSRRGSHVADSEGAVAECLEVENRLVYGGSSERVKQAIRRQLADSNSDET